MKRYPFKYFVNVITISERVWLWQILHKKCFVSIIPQIYMGHIGPLIILDKTSSFNTNLSSIRFPVASVFFIGGRVIIIYSFKYFISFLVTLQSLICEADGRLYYRKRKYYFIILYVSYYSVYCFMKKHNAFYHVLNMLKY